jgi:hypothetical protein
LFEHYSRGKKQPTIPPRLSPLPNPSPRWGEGLLASRCFGRLELLLRMRRPKPSAGIQPSKDHNRFLLVPKRELGHQEKAGAMGTLRFAHPLVRVPVCLVQMGIVCRGVLPNRRAIGDSRIAPHVILASAPYASPYAGRSDSLRIALAGHLCVLSGSAVSFPEPNRRLSDAIKAGSRSACRPAPVTRSRPSPRW